MYLTSSAILTAGSGDAMLLTSGKTLTVGALSSLLLRSSSLLTVSSTSTLELTSGVGLVLSSAVVSVSSPLSIGILKISSPGVSTVDTSSAACYLNLQSSLAVLNQASPSALLCPMHPTASFNPYIIDLPSSFSSSNPFSGYGVLTFTLFLDGSCTANCWGPYVLLASEPGLCLTTGMAGCLSLAFGSSYTLLYGSSGFRILSQATAGDVYPL
ncbi:MAG: hypothetical protein EOO65_02875 [Methanosarcinales archaeon]|nr:MAG: hypothetical protein EOO65_02875 [Methanosarcinales archaeon]